MNSITRLVSTGYALLFGGFVSAVAQDNALVTDRPDQTESAAIVRTGWAQVEMGWSVAQDDVAGFRTREAGLFQTLVRVGLGSRVEGRFGFAGLVSEDVRPPAGASFDETGAGDLDVGLKVKLLDARAGIPDVALLGGLALPTGSEPFQRRRADPRVRLVFANALSDRVGLGYNVGVEWNTDCDPVVLNGCGEKTFTDAFYTIAFGFGVTNVVGAFLEGFGTFALDDGRTSHHSVDGGLTFLVRANLQLDVSGGIGVNEEAGDWFAGLGVSVRLPR